MNELLLDVKDKFTKYELNNKYVKSNLILCEYTKPKYHITVQKFYSHCDNGKHIDLETL